MMDELVNDFKEKIQRENDHTPVATYVIGTLTEVIRRSNASTVMGLEQDLKEAHQKMKECMQTSISLTSSYNMFWTFVTKTSCEIPDFLEVKRQLVERGTNFMERSLASRAEIVTLSDHFIRDGVVVLTHGFSRVVLSLLLYAAEHGRNFSVIVTEGRPDAQGLTTAKRLTESGVPCTLILDSAAAYAMERVDMVLVGAEGVVENGGVINKMGTFQTAIVAKALKKPFYVAVEHFKFVRAYPLNQSDLGVPHSTIEDAEFLSAKPVEGVEVEKPMVDYTPPEYITLLFTDMGILTPSAVSDELIQIYDER